MVEIVNRVDYRVDVDGVELKNVTSHFLLSAEANETVNEETDTEEIGLDDCGFLTAKQPQS